VNHGLDTTTQWILGAIDPVLCSRDGVLLRSMTSVRAGNVLGAVRSQAVRSFATAAFLVGGGAALPHEPHFRESK
jgi:hypothetical protein